MRTTVAALANAALLDWNCSADELWARARALLFEPGASRFGLPKIWLGKSLAVVRNLQVYAGRSTEPPGTLMASTPQRLRVATASRDVALADFWTLDGRVLSVAQLVRVARLRDGMVLPAFPSATAVAAMAHACDWEEEARWMDELRRLKPARSPLQHARPRDPAAAAGCVVLPGFARGLSAPVDPVDFALAVVLAWLARTAGAEEFDIGLRYAQTAVLPGAYALLARTRPFRVHADFSQPFELFRQQCRSRVATWETRRPYLRDAVMRHPELARLRGWPDFASWPLALEMPARNGARYSAQDFSAALTFAIGAPGEVTLVHHGLPEAQLEKAARQLVSLAEDGLARPWAALGDLALLSQEEAAALRREVWGSQVRY